MTGHHHLTEAERHGAADGTLAPDALSEISEHLGACEACATDVARLKTLMTRTREAPTSLTVDGEDLWPSIRARIEQEKVAPLRDALSLRGDSRRYGLWLASLAIAASLIVVAALARRRPSPVGPAADAVARNASTARLTAVAESTRVYEEQARFLLNELELRRALMRPENAASADHELQVIDGAIAELRRAIERDPNNMALRALLASSYKQKVDLLKRITNAG
jgi:hypothetical protein